MSSMFQVASVDPTRKPAPYRGMARGRGPFQPKPAALCGSSHTIRDETAPFVPRPQVTDRRSLSQADLHFALLPSGSTNGEGSMEEPQDSSSTWWPCLASADFTSAAQLQHGIHDQRMHAAPDPEVRQQLLQDFDHLRYQMMAEMYEKYMTGDSNDLGDQLWFAMGHRPGGTEPLTYCRVHKFLSISDRDWYPTMRTLLLRSQQDPLLKEAMHDLQEYMQMVLPSNYNSNYPSFTTVQTHGPPGQTMTTVSQTARSPASIIPVAPVRTVVSVQQSAVASTRHETAMSDENRQNNNTATAMAAVGVTTGGEKVAAAAVAAIPTPSGEQRVGRLGTDENMSDSTDATSTTNNTKGAAVIGDPKRKRKQKEGRRKREETETSSTANKRTKKGAPLRYEWTGNKLQVPKWTEIKPLLEMSGYSFPDGKFCRPFGDPGENPVAQEGVDYFSDRREFRKYLCAHGVEYVGAPPWSTEHDDSELDQSSRIRRWVSLAVLHIDLDLDVVSELQMKPKDCLQLLRRIGIHYRTGLKDGYVLPGTTERLEEHELWEFLSKNGLPSGAQLGELDKMELLAIEQCISEYPRSEDFFVPRAMTKQESPSHVATTIAADASSASQASHISENEAADSVTENTEDKPQEEIIGKSPSQFNSAALRDINRAPTHQTSPVSQCNLMARDPDHDNTTEAHQNDSVITTLMKDAPPDHVQNPGRDTQTVPPQENRLPEPPLIDEKATSLETEEEEDEELEPDTIHDVDLPGTTVRDKLDACMEALRKMNEQVVVCKKIQKPRKEILKFLRTVVSTKGATGPRKSMPVMHVCGAPGSGKSLTVQKCCNMVRDEIERTSEDWEVSPRFCYINCSHLQNVNHDDALSKTMEYAECGNEKNLNRPADDVDSDRPPVIFVLDEIDLLVQGTNARTKQTKSESYIRTMLRWACDEDYMVGIIGISNSVENGQVTRLRELGFAQSNKVVFRTYDPNDLIHIAVNRIGKSVVEEKALEFLSKQVAGSSGDARKFFEMLTRSIAQTIARLDDATLDGPLEKPVVRIPDITGALRANCVKLKEIITSTPLFPRMLLCVCVHLEPTLGSRPIPADTLTRICITASEGVFLDSADGDHIRDYLVLLVDHGLLKLQDFDPMVRQQCIRLDSQLEDVRGAVDEFLINGESSHVFQRIVRKLKEMKVDNWDF